jgi:hypothetical protein
MTAEDDQPYVVESPSRIKLSPEAKYWAQEHGMTLTEMGRYLLQQHAQQQAAQEGEASNFEGAGSGLSGEPSENIEDPRQDPEYVRDHWLEQYAPGPCAECTNLRTWWVIERARVWGHRARNRPCASTGVWTDKAAISACLRIPIWRSSPGAASPERTTKERSMSLKFANRPSLIYGGSNRHSRNWGARFPAGA